MDERSGRRIGGKPFSRGALYLILQNRTYLGEIVHNGRSHPGEHPPIIDQPLWDTAQAQLAGTVDRNSATRIRQPSLLTGMLFDSSGNSMTPTHAVNKGTRYRYYVSRPLITKDRSDGSAGLRLPAEEIEQLVTGRVRQWPLDPGIIYPVTQRTDPSAQRRLIARAAEIGKSWPHARNRPARLACWSGGTHRHRCQPDRCPCPRDTARRALRWSSRAIGG